MFRRTPKPPTLRGTFLKLAAFAALLTSCGTMWQQAQPAPITSLTLVEYNERFQREVVNEIIALGCDTIETCSAPHLAIMLRDYGKLRQAIRAGQGAELPRLTPVPVPVEPKPSSYLITPSQAWATALRTDN